MISSTDVKSHSKYVHQCGNFTIMPTDMATAMILFPLKIFMSRPKTAVCIL